MSKNNIIIIIFLALASCTTIPPGEKSLIQKVERDAKGQVIKGSNIPDIQLGRPKFVRAYAYPQLIDGEDLFEGGFVNLYVGRETLSLEDLLKDEDVEVKDDISIPKAN